MKLHVPFCFLSIAAGLLLGDQASAHFMWLTTEAKDGQSQAVHYFSESAHAQDYHLPERVAETKVQLYVAGQEPRPLDLQPVETDEQVGKKGPLGTTGPAALAATCEYGIYGGALLTYYAKHLHGSDETPFPELPLIQQLALEIVPRLVDGRIELTVYFEGEPKADVAVEIVESNEALHSLTTDKAGCVQYKPTGVGLVGVRAGFTDREVQGELAGEQYVGISRYATLTYRLASLKPGNEREQSTRPLEDAAAHQEQLPELPEAVASFGAAVHDGWLYVYSGHRGTAHDHSRENLSPRFQRLQLHGGQAWESLPIDEPLQGLAMVAHPSGVYRIGGLDARNAANEAEDLHSCATFARFDPDAGQWTQLTDLPAPRSSHEAVVVGDRIFVAGGWNLAGEAEGTWLHSVLQYDLGNPEAGWQPLAPAPFQRRAAAVSHWQGKLVVLGGIDPEGGVSFRTDLLDLASQRWSVGPELPGEGMEAFGVSAWNLDDQLYVSGIGGRLLRLDSDGKGWTEVATLREPSFFHQLLPYDQSTLIAVGGASQKGHLRRVERIRLPNSDQSARPGAADAALTNR